MVDSLRFSRSSSCRPDSRRTLLQWVPQFLSFHRTLLALIWALGFVFIIAWQRAAVDRFWGPPARSIPRLRPLVFNLADFGAVGDGITVNTNAFERAVSEIRRRGGGQLNVEAGRWLTAPFNLTSHMTLFLAQNAVILGIDDENHWLLMPPLPSYGFGRERAGPRYGSLIHGQNLTDVVITGHNGTINGQGQTWWTKYRKNLLNYTRGPLLQLMWSRDILISDVTLRDSPFWTLHPYDCQNVTISNVTILAPLSGAPNTDGIDPDSCKDVLIEHSYISVGDDGIAIKSGWDQYGIAYGRPSANILIRNVVVRSMISAGVSIGSEMSGGVTNVTVENLLVWNSKRGIRIKTSAGRGGFVRHITYQNLTLDNVRVGIVIKTDYNEHPDEGYNPNALPLIEDIRFDGIRGQGVRIPVRIYGSQEIPVRNVSFKDMLVGITYKKKRIFQCSYVQGHVIGKIFPAPCENLDVYDEQGRLLRQSTSQSSDDTEYDP
ncbi:probable polygalacturonase isoform X2 [Salvia splendens]|uniref:probable polygalacturonase isoform X2 n=1 Tax=Salvia splendens TaxID=180675 RepID=UPI001C262FAE|nr:probable polygalacturonase isoform X2 [Salvia splendens]